MQQKSIYHENTNEGYKSAPLIGLCYQCHERSEQLVKPCKCDSLWDVDCLRNEFHKLHQQHPDSLVQYTNQYASMYTTQCQKCFSTLKYVDEAYSEGFGVPEKKVLFWLGWIGLVGWNGLAWSFVFSVRDRFVFQIVVFLGFFMAVLPTICLGDTLLQQMNVMKRKDEVKVNVELLRGKVLCRVCFQSQGEFIQPCSCELPTPNIHKQCFSQQIQQKYEQTQVAKRTNLYQCKCGKKIKFTTTQQLSFKKSLKIWIGLGFWLLSWIIPCICGILLDNWNRVIPFYIVSAVFPTPLVLLVLKTEIWKTNIQLLFDQVVEDL